jgi:hypothetical protein
LSRALSMFTREERSMAAWASLRVTYTGQVREVCRITTSEVQGGVQEGNHAQWLHCLC